MQSIAAQLYLRTDNASYNFENKVWTWQIDFLTLLGEQCIYGKKFNLMLNSYMNYETVSSNSPRRHQMIYLYSSALDFKNSSFNQGVPGILQKTRGAMIPFFAPPGNVGITGITYLNTTCINSFYLRQPNSDVTIDIRTPNFGFGGTITNNNTNLQPAIFVFTIFEILPLPKPVRVLKQTNQLVLSSYQAGMLAATRTDADFYNIDLTPIIHNPRIGKKYNLILRNVVFDGTSSVNLHLDLLFQASGMYFKTYRGLTTTNQAVAGVVRVNSSSVITYNTPLAFISTFILLSQNINIHITLNPKSIETTDLPSANTVSNWQFHFDIEPVKERGKCGKPSYLCTCN